MQSRRESGRVAALDAGSSHRVTVRAIDIAGQEATATRTVSVDIVVSSPANVVTSFTKDGLERSMEPGDRLEDADGLTVQWDAAPDIDYYAGSMQGWTPELSTLAPTMPGTTASWTIMGHPS